MKKNKWLTVAIALALSGVMIWAVPAFAQGRGNRGQRGQGQGRGYQACPGGGNGPAGTCPAYPNYQNRQGSRGNNSQANSGRQAKQGGGRNYQSQTRNNPTQ